MGPSQGAQGGTKEAPGRHQRCIRDAPAMHQGGTCTSSWALGKPHYQENREKKSRTVDHGLWVVEHHNAYTTQVRSNMLWAQGQAIFVHQRCTKEATARWRPRARFPLPPYSLFPLPFSSWLLPIPFSSSLNSPLLMQHWSTYASPMHQGDTKEEPRMHEKTITN